MHIYILIGCSETLGMKSYENSFRIVIRKRVSTGVSIQYGGRYDRSKVVVHA